MLRNNQERIVVLDTGAGGCVVSSTYLASEDEYRAQHMQPRRHGVWPGYGSTLKPVESYTSIAIFGHERGKSRWEIKFTVIEVETLPLYFIIGNNALHLYGMKLHISE